jgi:hypothetical protein
MCLVWFLEHSNGKEKEKENDETKVGAPEIADAAAAKFAPRGDALRSARDF